MKKRSIIKYVMFSIVLVIGLVLSFARFTIPFTDYIFNGFVNSIKVGSDLKGGISAVYEATPSNNAGTTSFETCLNETIKKVENIVGKEYGPVNIMKQDSDMIRVEVRDYDDPKKVLTLLGKPVKLEVRKTDSLDDEVVLSSEYVTDAYASYNNGYGVIINFNGIGTDKLKTLKDGIASGGQLYFYIDGEAKTVTSDAINNSIAFVGGMSSADQANEFAYRILSGTFKVNLELISNDKICATLGDNALLLIIIASSVALLLAFLFLWLRYGDFGLLASASIILNIILLFFLYQAIPLVHLTLSGVAGLIFSMFLVFIANIIYFERIKDEYKVGKSLEASVKSAYKRSALAVLDSNAVILIASLIFYLLAAGAIKDFAFALFIGILVAVFTSLIVTRWLVKVYLPLNNKNVKRLRLKREAENGKI